MEDLLVGLLEVFLEIFGEFVLQMLFELVAEALSGLINPRTQSDPAFSAIVITLSGVAFGLLSVWLFPHQLIATRLVFPGASLLLAPIATGSTMHLFGKRLSRLGQDPSDLATFRGGILFAFSMALIRWWLVGTHH